TRGRWPAGGRPVYGGSRRPWAGAGRSVPFRPPEKRPFAEGKAARRARRSAVGHGRRAPRDGGRGGAAWGGGGATARPYWAAPRLEELKPEEFAAVYATKAESLRHVLAGLDLPRQKWLALFSSTTARLGRVGQAAYAMANEVLNKTAQKLRRELPSCRVVAVN